MDRKEHFCSIIIRVFERSLTKISKRLAKRNLAIPNMHDERRQPIKKKKKKEREEDKGEEIRQLGGGFSTSLAPREGKIFKRSKLRIKLLG